MKCTATIPRGYYLDLKAKQTPHAHLFCGQHTIPGAACPNCRKPMLRMLSLDTTDPRLGLASLPFASLPLLFCWTCRLAQGHTAYRLEANGGVTLIQYNKGPKEDGFPYDNYPDHFPGARIELTPVPSKVQGYLTRINARELDPYSVPKKYRDLCEIPQHQVGGEPHFIQEEPTVTCPVCKEPMAFLATIGDRTIDSDGFTGNEFVQVIFMFCGRDCVVLSYQECD